MPALGCHVRAIEAGACSEAARLSSAAGSCQCSPQAITTGQRGAARAHGLNGRVGTGAPESPWPCCVAERALPSPVEIKHRMGMGKEGGWQQPAASLGGGGAGEGILLHLPREGVCVFSCSHLPGLTFSSSASWVSQQPLCWGGQRAAAAAAPGHMPGNTTSWGQAPRAGGEGARVTLPCLENMNLQVKVGVGPCPSHRVP